MRNFSANYSAKRKVEQIENRESVLRHIFGRSNAQLFPTHLDKCRAESSMKNENNLSTDSHGIFSPAKDGFAVFEAKTISTETDHVQVFVPPGCGSLHCFSGGKVFFHDHYGDLLTSRAWSDRDALRRRRREAFPPLHLRIRFGVRMPEKI